GSLASHLATGFAQHSQHIPIAHLGAAKLDALLSQRDFETQVAHYRPDHGPLQQAGALARGGNDVDELVAIDLAAEAVDHDQAVAITVERNTRGRAHARHREL